MAKNNNQNDLLKKLKRPESQLAAAIFLFLISAFIVSDKTISSLEEAVFNAIYYLPAELTPLFLVITQLGNIFVLFVLAGFFLFKRHYTIVIRLLMSGLLAYLVTGVCKDLIGRGRPNEFFADVIYRDALVRGPGFPSGHVALATAIGLTLWHYLPKKYRYIAPLMILSVGLSRIFLGVHAPVDIIGGFAIGWGAVEIFRFVALRDLRKASK